MVTVAGQQEGQMTINTFYYADAGAALAANTEITIANGWLTNVGGLYNGAISTDWVMKSIKVQCITSPARIPQFATAVLPASGGGPAIHEPTQIAGIIQRRTGIKGQSGRGRVMIPCVPSGWTVNSTIVLGAAVAAYTALANAIAANMVIGGITYTPGVLSRRPVAGLPAFGFAPLISATPVYLLGTVRRRRIGRGK
jgi:hypothetical protein